MTQGSKGDTHFPLSSDCVPPDGVDASLPYLGASMQSLEGKVRAAEEAVPSLALLRARAEALRLSGAVGVVDAWGKKQRQGILEAASAKARAHFAEARSKAIYGHMLNGLANVAGEARFLALRARLYAHTEDVSHQIARFEALSRALERSTEAIGTPNMASRQFREVSFAFTSRLERLEADVEEIVAAEDCSGNSGQGLSDQFKTLEECRRSVVAPQGDLERLGDPEPAVHEEEEPAAAWEAVGRPSQAGEF